MIKNIERVADASRAGTEIYYSIKEQAVYTEAGNGREKVTYLLRKNSVQEIEEAIKRWLWM